MATHDPLAATIHKTNAMLADIERALQWNDRHRAWSALRVVLHVLRDRLSVEEAVALAAQLPLLVRGAYYEGWCPSRVPIRIRTRDAFFERVAAELPDLTAHQIEELTRQVLKVVADHVSLGEVEHVARILPTQISALWAS